MRAAAIALFLIAAIAGSIMLSRNALLGDFRTFYCTGSLTLQHENAYQAQPLHDCEIAAMPPQVAQAWRDLAIPAPLPPYAVALFVPFALLPYGQAAAIWVFLSLCAVGAGAAALLRLTKVSTVVIVCAIGLSLFGTSIMLGQIIPLTFAGLCFAALFVQRRQWAAASAAACITMIAPHVGIPVCVSLALWAPRTRFYLAAFIALAVIISLLVLGPAADIAYVLKVVSARAIFELGSEQQYSISVIFQALGLHYVPAVLAGAAIYVVLAIAGIALARSAAIQLSNNAMLVLLPPAFGIAGAAFTHLSATALAIPLALVLVDRSRASEKYAFVALLLLAIPWPLAQSAILPGLAAIIAYVLTWELRGRRVRLSLQVASLAFLSAFVLHMLYLTYGALMNPPALAVVDPMFVLSWIEHLATWAGLFVLVFGVVLLYYRNVPLQSMARGI